MPLVQSLLTSGLKAAFEKLAKSKDAESNGQGVNTSPNAAKEIANAYHAYASVGLAGVNTVGAQAANFESGLLSAPLPAGLDAALVAYWVTDVNSMTAVAPFIKCVTTVTGPLSFSFSNVPTSQAAADALAAALHTYTTSKVQVVATAPAGPSTLNLS